ncbi:MAG: Do family serine endopeptidase [Gammaproteobacteria bacterium]|nr:Do family serine endopeptidase [Gammaproteobacteria bacterium]
MNERKVNRGWRTLALSTVASAVLLAASITLPGHSATDGGPAGPVANTDVRNGFADLIEQVEPSVVTIEVNKTMEARPSAFGGDPRAEEFFERFFGQRGVTPRQPRQAQGVGSGFVIDESGYIVTNNHVIDGADTVTVRLIDGAEHDAAVIGIDAQTDLALLKIDAENLVATRLGDSDETRVGDWVVAIGNPFGLGGTATAGIVSARSRDIRSGPYDDYLQIDAPINRGNSGGPVFNTDGEVVGVNTAIFSPNGGSVGIGFAIPVNQVRDIVDELRSDGSIDRGWLGVQLQSIDRDLADSLGLDSRNGALVADVVAGSPAQRAGIEVGDVIVGFDNEDVANSRELARLVGNSDSGDEASVVIIRDGDEISLEVRLGDAATQIAATDQEQKLQDLGLTLAPLTQDLRQRLDIDDGIDGAVVVRIDPDGSAAASGLRRGDILMRADRRQVESPQDFEIALSAARKKGRNSLPVLVRRGESQQFMSLSTG